MNEATVSASIGDENPVQNIVREVVGVFDSPAHLQATVDHWRPTVSTARRYPCSASSNRAGAGSTPRRDRDVSDDPSTPTAAFMSDASWREARGVATAVPLVIGGFGGAWAVAATGGALVLAIGATVASGAVGAGLGALLYHAVARRHAAAIRDQMATGGLILWVLVADEATEARALAALQECGAEFVQTHMIDRHWGVADSPLHRVQPDPFLEHDPSVDAA